ncbi:hypothetical protein PP175_10395 [Aneurinibacillus sp. Ricciae_BoGa-3]|uniref:hypothetical protein n=1 Tax=Aneurinibacillus sp. Ricciae_BoGa-3 TaxID=3022697 RepID=UPI002341F21A|nr:hypothetical protein [Aneurinibacillus sp. Ricciae_BoGa-3]WCK56281.1 hypothetical protein PP175_10395 [Aneurinibacillus sp. Ricciae_BoGa-3]
MFDFSSTGEQQEMIEKASIFMDEYVYHNEKYMSYRQKPNRSLYFRFHGTGCRKF